MTEEDRPATKPPPKRTKQALDHPDIVLDAPGQADDLFWTHLTRPFPPEDIERLPKLLDREDRDKGRCVAGGHSADRISADGHYCGGWHARSVHLDYIGHAGITMRLNEVCGPNGWSWEPYAVTPQGLPGWVNDELWIRLTITPPSGVPVTKIGVGDDDRRAKVLVGDALRNAAMRFGIATYLWAKSDRALAMARVEDDPRPPVEPTPVPRDDTISLLTRLDELAASQGNDREGISAKWRERNGGIPVEALDALAPMTLAPLVASIEAWIEAQQGKTA